MGAHLKERKRGRPGLSSSHHLVINHVEKQHRKRRITKREGDETNESERGNDRNKERGRENKKGREKYVQNERNVDGNYNY
jgi:hypothetical protein